MPHKKPSFFERLTGTLQAEEAINKVTTVSKATVVAAPSLNTRTPQQKFQDKTFESDKTKPSDNRLTNKDDNWLPDAEGQLAIDVYQTPSDIVIKSTIAGVSNDSLDVSITNDMVTIKGRRAKDEDIKADDYYYQECYWGPFSRSIILPTDVLADQVSAVLKNGILTIKLPKAEKVRTKKIKIETA